MTAAHCLYDEQQLLPTAALSVILGLHDRTKLMEERRYSSDCLFSFHLMNPRKYFSVKQVFIHDKFISGQPGADVALLRLGKKQTVKKFSLEFQN